jgi:predicted lipid-binding transport protein (Tim44 family)
MDLLILAAVAGFLLYRLNAVLGQRDKDDPAEKNAFKNPFSVNEAEKDAEKPGNIISLPGRSGPARVEELPSIRDDGPLPLDKQIQILHQADPDFDENNFLAGAKIAFGMVVEAFARGDRDALRPLLSNDIFRDFDGEIVERLAEGQRLETIIESIDDVAITHGKVTKDIMEITVRIVSTQNNRVFDRDNNIVSGDEKPDEVIDFWVFRRLITARNPNWTLIATDAG